MIVYDHLEVDGRRAAMWRHESEGPALVLVHGAGANASVWLPLARELSSFDLVAPSLPGRAGTEGHAFDRADDAAAWLDRVLDGLGASSAIVLGHSYGGAVALELALRSERVAGIVLVASGARLRVHPVILDAAARAVESREPMSVDFAFSRAASKEAVRAYAEAAASTPPEAALSDWRACDAFDAMARLGSVRAPVLVVGGAEDALTPPAYQRHMAERLPRASLAIVEGTGHMLPWERPSELASQIRAWGAATS